MPKMSADYLMNIRNKILDAAYAVCMSKPMHQVSMRDIINEVGFSQGNIYRYFSNLDDILIALFNRNYIGYDKERVTAVVSSDELPEVVISCLCRILEEFIDSSVNGIGKIKFELEAVFVNNPERIQYFNSKTYFVPDLIYFFEKFTAYITRKTDEGYFKPLIPLEDIYNHFYASFDGIVRDLILDKHYRIDSQFASPELDSKRLFKSLCTSLLLLLGGEINKLNDSN